MKTISDRLGSTARREVGLSLIEVMVAMLIFAIISIGVIGSLTAMLRQVSDSRSREVATNLAAQEIDLARSTTNLFALHDYASPVVVSVDGQNFYVSRDTEWVSDPTSMAACGAGTGALQYKRVNIKVGWAGMLSSQPVRADTLIAPKTRVSESTKATIIVKVTTQFAAGVDGVAITTNPAISPPPTATDIDGCSYLLKVPPGSYTITVSKSGYIDAQQAGTPSQTVAVTAGTSIAAAFQMEPAQPLTATYGTSGTKIPTNMNTSLRHASDPVIDSVATNNSLTRSFSLFPWAEGFTVLAGKFVAGNEATAGCLSPNPAEWPAGTNSGGVAIQSPTPRAWVPAAGVTVPVNMGIVTVTGTSNTLQLTAVSQATPPPGTADPGCAIGAMTYTFGSVLVKNAPVQIALPFGSWKLYYGTSASGPQLAASTLMVPPSSSSTVSSGGILTLDPRIVPAP